MHGDPPPTKGTQTIAAPLKWVPGGVCVHAVVMRDVPAYLPRRGELPFAWVSWLLYSAGHPTCGDCLTVDSINITTFQAICIPYIQTIQTKGAERNYTSAPERILS